MTKIDKNELNEKIAKLSPEKRRLLELRLKEKGTSLPVDDQISPRLSNEASPLSFSQRRLWFLHQLHPDMIAFNLPMALRFSGKLDRNLLSKSINAILSRHEVLRTTYIEKNGVPLQFVHPPLEVELEQFDLTRLREEEKESEAERLILNEIQQPFDLSRDIMFKSFLYRIGPQDHIFFLLRHHIASDGWSARIVQRELLEGYLALQERRSPDLPQLQVQYADYAIWQWERLHQQGFARELDYWRDQLKGLPQLELPIDQPRPSIISYNGSQIPIKITPSLTQKLISLSQQQRVTMNTTLLAAYSVLLYRYTGQDDFAIGVPVSGRTRRVLEPLIGFFINTLVLRTDLSGNPTFLDLLHQINQTSIEALDHQHLPFEILVEDLQPDRQLNRSPLAQATFQYQDIPIQPTTNIPGLSIEHIPIDPGTSQNDLSLTITKSAEGLEGFARFNTDLFEAATIARFIDYYKNLLTDVVDHPDRQICQLMLLTHKDKEKIKAPQILVRPTIEFEEFNLKEVNGTVVQ
ncbi:MAG: condensation domain-containing protein, partial [Anaerolineales bacterium]